MTRPTHAMIPVLLASLSILVPAIAQEKPVPDAASVLDRYESKVGGEKIRANLESLVIKGKSEVDGMPGAGSFEEIYVGKDRVKVSNEWPGMGGMTMGRAGDVAWSTDPAMGITVREGDDAAAVHRLFGIQRLAPWRELYTSAKVDARSTVEGRPVTIITMTPAVGASERWSIDDASGLLTRVSTSLPDPMGGQIAMDWVFDDWKPVKGILFPHVRRQEVGTMKIVYRVESVAVNGEVDPARVAPDGDVRLAIEDPKRRTKKAPSAGTFEIETLTKTPALAIRATIKPADVSRTLASLLPEVFTFAGKSGAQIGGPPFTRYHRVDEDSIELEAGIPVREAVAGEGRIKAIELPAGRAVVTWHIGPYPELPKTYELLKTWMTKNDARSRDAFWEVYWTDPGLEPDPGKWRTQIIWPIE